MAATAAATDTASSAATSPAQALRAALEALPDASVLVVSADRPLLTPDLLIGLAGRPDAPAVVPRDARGAHLACARYDAPAILPELCRCIDAGDPEGFLSTTPVQWLEGEALAALDPDGSRLRRIDSAAQLERVARADSTRTLGFWPGDPGPDPGDPAAREPGSARFD
jgi:molybdopterin-guanine dinucleotide biosynthesis protein A